jgi:hypothetical protein
MVIDPAYVPLPMVLPREGLEYSCIHHDEKGGFRVAAIAPATLGAEGARRPSTKPVAGDSVVGESENSTV